MKPEIENLKAWMSGKSTTGYQRALAMREFEQLLTYVAELEQLRQPPVSGSLPHDINEFFDWLCEKGWIDGIANTSANNPNIFYEPKDLYELFRSGNDR